MIKQKKKKERDRERNLKNKNTKKTLLIKIIEERKKRKLK